MSGHRYISDPANLFDDVDDETFLKNSRRNYSDYNAQPSNLDEQLLTLQERKKAIEDRTLRSTERSIGLLRDSEQVGIATAEELMRQREQLERTDKRLDEINATLRFSQKHINGIKSVFGSLKNYLSGKNDQTPPKPSVPDFEPSPRPNTLRDSVPEVDRYDSHPATRLRGLDENERRGGASASQSISAALDANLEEMCMSITRLKGLAEGLGEEIDSQNELVDNITTKTDKADITIERQNKEMKRILKK